MIFAKPKPTEKPREKTIGDVLGGTDGRVMLNFSRMQKAIKECEEKDRNHECRVKLKEVGIEFADE